ncbi:MAG: hypothetical protein QOI96_1416, partial [Verrucomicrobiota bacterium]
MRALPQELAQLFPSESRLFKNVMQRSARDLMMHRHNRAPTTG